MRQEAGAGPVLFASVLHGDAAQAELRVRLLRVVLFILALHLLGVEAEGGAVATGAALDSVEGAVVGGGEGGVLGGVLPGGVPGPPPLTPEEREERMERYMKALIRERFERVRYPHLASAAGIQGEVLMRVSISAQGQLLELELLGRCPHPVLCNSAQETVRNAEPFPPPPPELGSPCLLELPFRYRIR